MSENQNRSAIESVARAFTSRRRPVEVKEWGLTLYFPPMTTASHIAVEERLGPRTEENAPSYESRRRLLLLIHQAELEDGSAAFAFGDLETLIQKADYLVLQRLIGEMYASSMPATVEEAKKD